MKVTLERDADVAQFEITAQHNPDNLVVKVDGASAEYEYANSTVILHDLAEGQTVEIAEDTPPLKLEGEDPIQVDVYPTITRIKFKINSLDPLPEPADG